MKSDRCSWCGQEIEIGTSFLSNGKSYHNDCLASRNLAGKIQRHEAATEEVSEYEPSFNSAAIKRQSSAELVRANDANWKETARQSRLRIIAKYGNGLFR